MAKNTVDGYIDKIGDAFSQLPALPKGGKDFFVTILPWIALIFGILGILRGISGLGLFSYFSPAMYWGGSDAVGRAMLSSLLALVSSVLLLMSFKGVSDKKAKGWKLFYYSEVVALLSNIVVFSLAGIVFTLLGFYVLYQIKSYYK